MAKFPFFKFWPANYLADTTHLSPLEHGVYLLLLLAEWQSPDCRLPNDDITLARYAHLTKQQWSRIKNEIMPFFSEDENGRLFQKRLIKEFNSCQMRMKKCSTAGRASALKRQGTISTVVATDVPSMCNQLESKKSKEESKTDSPEAHLYSTPNESSYMGAAEKSGADDIRVGSISRDGTAFVFYGQVVRISEKVFERWKCAYPHIADLFGMLQQRDDFFDEPVARCAEKLVPLDERVAQQPESRNRGKTGEETISNRGFVWLSVICERGLLWIRKRHSPMPG